jgi:hypothetical protein
MARLKMGLWMIRLRMKMRDETYARRDDIPNMMMGLVPKTRGRGDEDASRDDKRRKL